MAAAILSAASVAICTGRVEAKYPVIFGLKDDEDVAICTGRVEAKASLSRDGRTFRWVAICTGRVEAKSAERCNADGSAVAICTGRVEAKRSANAHIRIICRCNLHGACGGKGLHTQRPSCSRRCNLHGACGGKGFLSIQPLTAQRLQSARGVWRQRSSHAADARLRWTVAICTGRVEAKASGSSQDFSSRALQSARGVQRNRTSSSPEKNPRKFMQTYCIFIHLGV